MSQATAEKIEQGDKRFGFVKLVDAAPIGEPGRGSLGMDPQYVDLQTRHVNVDLLPPVCRQCGTTCEVLAGIILATFPPELWPHNGGWLCLLTPEKARGGGSPPGSG